MRHLPKLAAVAAIAFCVIAAPAAAQSPSDGDRVLDLGRSTPLREYAGTLLFSRWDGSAYRLAIRRGGVVRDLAVPAQRTPFDADIGPDSRGRSSAAVSICRGSCDLFVIGLDAGDRLRRVNNANTTGHDEIAPTVWKGRLAFGRRYGKDLVIPYTKLLNAPRSRPSNRVGSLPRRRCNRGNCRRLLNQDLKAMDLWGRWIAQSWTHGDPGPGSFQNEIRLTNVRRTDTRQIAAVTTGLSGQSYLGPAFTSGYVGFFRACQGDPGGCKSGNSGAIRYRISTGRYEIVAGNEAWSGWTLASRGTDYHVPSAFDCDGGDPGFLPTVPCGIYRRSGLQWKSIDEERIR